MRAAIFTSLLACSGLATPLIAARSEPYSWGKPGVAIADYRRDALECGRAGYYMDVSHTEAASVFKDATKRLETNEAGLATTASMMADPNFAVRQSAMASVMNTIAVSAHIVEGARPQERIHEVGSLMQAKVDDCLKARGYVRFKLTPEQRNQLQRLHLGSPARHDYLYRLSIDPAVLQSQAAPL